MKRVLAISVLGGLLAVNSAVANVETAKTIAAVLQDLGLSAETIGGEPGDADIAQTAEALVSHGISVEQAISLFAANGNNQDVLLAVEALVRISPENTASIVQTAVTARPEITTEVVRSLVADSGSATAAKVIVDAAIQASIALEGASEFVVNDIVAAAIYGAADQAGV